MSANPYRLGQKVSKNTELFEIACVYNAYGELIEKIIVEHEKPMTLHDVYKKHAKSRETFLKVTFELGVWGVIFRTGNYGSKEDWEVYAVTLGSA